MRLARQMARRKAKRLLLLTFLLFLFLVYSCRLASIVPPQAPAEKSTRRSNPILPEGSVLESSATASTDTGDDESYNDDNEYNGIDNGCWEWTTAEQDVFCTVDFCRHVATTTLYCSCCGGSSPRILRPLLITGTPRSGTVYFGTLLSSLGLRMALDTGVATRNGGIVSWAHLYPDPHPDLHFTQHMEPPAYYENVIQMVRDPLASLTSIAFTEPLLHDAGYLRFLHRHGAVSNATTVTFTNNQMAISNEGTNGTEVIAKIRIRRALEFYTTWHRAIADLHVPLLRLEDLDVAMVQTIFAYTDVATVPSAKKIELALHQKGRRLTASHYHQNDTASSSSSSSCDVVFRRFLASQRLTGPLRRRRQRKPPRRHRPDEVRSNQRRHRPRLEWNELCRVDEVLTVKFLELAQSFGYFDEIEDVSSVCMDDS